MAKESDRRDVESTKLGDGDGHTWRGARGTSARRPRPLRWLDLVASTGSAARTAARRLVRTPALLCGASLTLGLGLGANGVMFGTVDRLLLRAPDHVRDADRVKQLVVHYRTSGGTGDLVSQSVVTYPHYLDLRSAVSFEAIGLFASRPLLYGRGGEAQRVSASFVTASFLQLTGAVPALGRFFREDEDLVGGPSVVVLGHRFWRTRFGGLASVIGTTVELGAGRYQVIGVAPDGFTGVSPSDTDVWLPLLPAATEIRSNYRWMESRGSAFLQAVVRLAPDVQIEAAEAEATRVHRLGNAADPSGLSHDPEARIELVGIRGADAPGIARQADVAGWLVALSLLVLLIACANVAGLLLARGIRRRRETAVRLALGITRRRLVGEFALEGAIIALAGGTLAVAITLWSAPLVRDLLLPGIRWATPSGQLRLGLFLAGATLLAALLAGVIPALQSTRADIDDALGSHGRGGSRARTRMQAALVAGQTALTVPLLFGAILFARSLRTANAIDLGYTTDDVGVAMLELEAPDTPYEDITELYEAAGDRLLGLPGVSSTAWAAGVPFWTAWSVGIRPQGSDTVLSLPGGGPFYSLVSPGYFRTLGLELRRGRPIDASDTPGSGPVAVVDEALARLAWPTEDAIGRCLFLGGDGEEACTTVVGVVEDTRRLALADGREAHLYLPISQHVDELPAEALFVAVDDDPRELGGVIQRELVSLSPTIRFATVSPMREFVDPLTRSWSLGATMLTGLGVLAVCVAAIGVFSSLAFAVAQRRTELGVRAALGATEARLITGVFRDSFSVVVPGILVGLAAAFFAAGYIEPLLFDISPRDPVTALLVGVLIVLVTSVASAIPAYRASKATPTQLLRAD